MADKEEKKEKKQEQKEEKEEQQPQDEPKPQDESKKSSSLGLFTWLIMAAVVIAGLVGGFALAQLVAGTQSHQLSNANGENSLENKTIKEMLVEIPADAKLWNYDLEPVVANLDEPGVTRYARITVTMQLSPQMNQEKGTFFLEEKKLVLRDWLTTYIAGLSLEQVRGSRNLGRIKNEIRDAFNELIFPESKPFIHGILFKEFAVQ
jgi:flagellar basal body-associated protein FliL